MTQALAAVALANTLTVPGPREIADTGNLRAGQIALANEARFNAAYYSEEVTNYVVGWKDPNNIQDTLDFLFPPVMVGRRFEYKLLDNNEFLLSESDDVRAIGADFKRVEYKGSSQNEKTVNKGLTIRIDKDDAITKQPGWENTIAARLKQRLLRNDLRRGITAVGDAATNVAKTWDASAGKDPDQDILDQLILGADASGLRSNRILFGETAWTKRLLSHRAQTSAGGYSSAGLTVEELKGLLMVSDIKLSRERYQNAAATKAKIVPDIVLMFFGENGVGPEDPSNTKRFWSPCEDGGEWRVYVEPVGSKFIDITVEHYSNLIVTATAGLRKLTIS